MVPSSNHSEHTPLLAKVTSVQSKTLTHLRQRVITNVTTGHIHHMSMPMKALRVELQKVWRGGQKLSFDVLGVEMLRHKVSVDLIRH